ncbi:MAG: hypothetical protein KF825_13795 [Ferruginibacter sp.]|nr:hypothetical protein [Bacteroidota bacterium]MBX2935313.1 hypothetical protein [Ferruginibacter sp.]
MAESIANTYFEDVIAAGIPCPHEDAFVPDGVKVYYRVLKNNTVSSEYFLPTVVKDDRPLPQGYDNCIGKSVSVFDDLQVMINSIFRLPFNRGKKKTIGLLKLTANDGLLKQTFDNKNHHSWWRSKAFDIATVETKEITV